MVKPLPGRRRPILVKVSWARALAGGVGSSPARRSSRSLTACGTWLTRYESWSTPGRALARNAWPRPPAPGTAGRPGKARARRPRRPLVLDRAGFAGQRIEREDEVARAVGGQDRVGDVDVEQAGDDVVGRDLYDVDGDPGLPPLKRGPHGPRDQPAGARVHGGEDQGVDAAAELRPHRPFAGRRGQDQLDGAVNVGAAADQGDGSVAGDPGGEGPPLTHQRVRGAGHFTSTLGALMTMFAEASRVMLCEALRVNSLDVLMTMLSEASRVIFFAVSERVPDSRSRRTCTSPSPVVSSTPGFWSVSSRSMRSPPREDRDRRLTFPASVVSGTLSSLGLSLPLYRPPST